jgi:hypothetical protein
MPKKPKKSSVYFDEQTLGQLAEILRHSRIAKTQNAALRGLIDRYVKLLNIQSRVEAAGRRLALVALDADAGIASAQVQMEPVDLRL